MLQIVQLHFLIVDLLQQFVVLRLETLTLLGEVVDVLVEVLDLVGQVVRLRLPALGRLFSRMLQSMFICGR